MIKHLAACMTIISFLLFSGFAQADPNNPSYIQISSTRIPQGGVSLITIRSTPWEHPKVTWLNKKVHLIPNESNTYWKGFLAVDLTKKPGYDQVIVSMNPSDQTAQIKMEIVSKDYGLSRLTLPKHMVELDDKTLQRVLKEQKKMRKLWEAPHPNLLWKGTFIRPVPGKVISPFGTKRIINDQPRSPHSGIDMRGQTGTPIKTMNHGKIVLTDDFFFSGKSVVIDHGGEILSMYFHLNKILVQHGEYVKKGQVIGLIGSTGRASGPHLHWGIRLNRARVDPMMFIDLSRQLEG